MYRIDSTAIAKLDDVSFESLLSAKKALVREHIKINGRIYCFSIITKKGEGIHFRILTNE